MDNLMTVSTEVASWRLRRAGFDESQVRAAVQALVEAHEELAVRRHLKAELAQLKWMVMVAVALNVAVLAKLFL